MPTAKYEFSNPQLQIARAQTRRTFLKNSATGIGAIALASLLQRDGTAAPAHHAIPTPGAPRPMPSAQHPLAPRAPVFPAKAKRVIYLDMSGAPPQHDLFDYKPKLVELNMQPCPESLLKGQQFAFIKGTP